MSLLTKSLEELESTGKNYFVEDGLHNAICVAVADLGVVEVEFEGEKKTQNKMKVAWALEPKDDDGQHFVIEREFNAVISDKSTLKKFLTQSRIEIKEVVQLLDTRCKILTQIATGKNSGKKYVGINSYMAGEGFTPSGKIELPFWWGDFEPDCMAKLANAEIGEKRVKKDADSSELPY